MFHVETHHYCYPDTGIEMNLGSLPVVECNRWEPVGYGRKLFWDSQDGRHHRAQLDAWEAARAAEAAEVAEAQVLIDQSMSLEPNHIACQVCGGQFEETLLDVQMRCPQCRVRELEPRLPPKETP